MGVTAAVEAAIVPRVLTKIRGVAVLRRGQYSPSGSDSYQLDPEAAKARIFAISRSVGRP